MSLRDRKLATFASAVKRLEEALGQEKHPGLVGEMMRDAVIQRFEFTFEIAWKFLRFHLIDEGVFREDVASPKKAVKLAYANGLIVDGDIWLEMINTRNTLAHTYNEKEAIKLESAIATNYFDALKGLLEKCIVI